MRKYVSAAIGTLGTIGCMLALPGTATAASSLSFAMARSAAVENAGCALDAKARITVNSLGPVEVMHVEATGLPPNQEFDLFVIQQANAPFGMSWYQGDMESNASGRAVGVGLWFGSPEAAVAAGCPNTTTPFNGDHTAGIQVLSTRNFTGSGPLRNLAP